MFSRKIYGNLLGFLQLRNMKYVLILICFISDAIGSIIVNSLNSSEKLIVVSTYSGPIAGTIHVSYNEELIYYKFSGIPYAKPPVGNLRFEPPEPVSRWRLPLLATQEGSKCLQISDNEIVGSEDCLYLNVYTRNNQPTRPYAVMVWIHGGGFTQLSGNYETFGPDYFLDNDVLIVTLNYRLGALGWLSTEDEMAPGNYGLKDIILALKWVKNNIKAFGGCPNRITLFGESAGSVAVSYLVQSKQTEGLIHRAIMESGTSLCTWGLTRNPKNVALRLADQLNITDTKSTFKFIESLKRVDAKKIVMAQAIVKSQIELQNFLAGLAFGPVIEPPHWSAVVTESSYRTLSKGKFTRVPLIIGFNSNEMGDFFSDIVWHAALQNINSSPDYLAPYDLTQNTSKRKWAARALKIKYFDNGNLTNQIQNAIKFANFDQFIRPIRETVRLMSKYVDTYFYKFSYVGNAALPLEKRTYWGVAHGEEQYYLWMPHYPNSAKDVEIRLSLTSYWTAFAKLGSPFTKFQDFTTPWPKARNKRCEDDLYLLNLDYERFTTEKNSNQTDWKFYKNIFKTFGDGYYDTY